MKIQSLHWFLKWLVERNVWETSFEKIHLHSYFDGNQRCFVFILQNSATFLVYYRGKEWERGRAFGAPYGATYTTILDISIEGIELRVFETTEGSFLLHHSFIRKWVGYSVFRIHMFRKTNGSLNRFSKRLLERNVLRNVLWRDSLYSYLGKQTVLSTGFQKDYLREMFWETSFEGIHYTTI